MTKVTKLNSLLALREKQEKTFTNAIDDVFGKFKSKQGIFQGERKTYVALGENADEPSKRNFKVVQSTVKEQLDYLEEYNQDYFKNLFTIEKTNASGGAKAELIVEGKSWGEFYSTELLRLKSVLDSAKFKELYGHIPVRSESQLWEPTTDEIYTDREVFASPLDQGFAKTTLKETYIVFDPHADKGNRPPQLAEKSTQVNIGEYTVQNFSGEMSIYQRAKIIARLDKLIQAVVDALQRANDVEVIESTLGSKIFSYLHKGE